jgi:hypothetical protein
MAPPGDNVKGTTAADGLQADIDSLLEGMSATADRVEEAATHLAGQGGATSLEANVKELLADAPPPELAPDPMQAIDSLDAQLAELTAELLETNKPPSPTTQAAMTPAGVTDFEAAMAERGAGEIAPAAIQTSPEVPVAPAPVPVATPAPVRPPEVAPVATAVPAPAPVQAVTRAESAALAETPAEKEPGAVLRLFAAISAPVNNSSHMVRVIVTVMAIQTAVVSACVWGWYYFRPATTPVQGPAFNLSSDTLPRPVEPAVDTSKTASGAGTGHGAPKAEKSKAKPSSNKDAKKAASGGGH